MIELQHIATIYDGNEDVICECTYCGDSKEAVEYIRLLKAAPDLLSLLQEGVNGFNNILVDSSQSKHVRDWCKRAQAAIDKATTVD